MEMVYRNHKDRWTAKKPHRELAKLVNRRKLRPCKALDVGCGRGYDSIYLASKGFDVLGVDYSENAIAASRQNAKKAGVRVRFRELDIFDLKSLDEKFDFVLEWSVMHHISKDKRKAYINIINSLLNPGGFYLSVSFNINSKKFGEKGAIQRTSSISGCTLYFSHYHELKSLFEKHFEIIQSPSLFSLHSERKTFFIEKCAYGLFELLTRLSHHLNGRKNSFFMRKHCPC